MYRVKTFGLLLVYFQHLHAENPETFFFKHAKDIAGGILADCVGLND